MIVKIAIIVILIIFCIIVLIILGVYLWSEWKNHFYHRAPTISSYTTHYQVMKKYLILEDNKTLIDLGCGTGSAMRFFRKYYKLEKIHGIDNNFIAVIAARLLSRIYGYPEFITRYGDIQETDISEYDYIYLFLLPKHLDALQNWLQKNMKSEAIIVCNTFSFSDRKPRQEIYDIESRSVIRLYKK